MIDFINIKDLRGRLTTSGFIVAILCAFYFGLYEMTQSGFSRIHEPSVRKPNSSSLLHTTAYIKKLNHTYSQVHTGKKIFKKNILEKIARIKDLLKIQNITSKDVTRNYNLKDITMQNLTGQQNLQNITSKDLTGHQNLQKNAINFIWQRNLQNSTILNVSRQRSLQNLRRGNITQQFNLKNVSIKNFTKPENLRKIILMYNPLYWWEEWVNNTWETSDVFRKCPISNCIISKNVSYFNKSDAVIFKLQQFNELPKHKKRGQVWIFAQFEPPPILHHPNIYEKYRNLINWTLSYRRDSDFTVTHGQFKKYARPNLSIVDKKINSTTKMAVIFNSHCFTQSLREEYIKVLKQSVSVNIYGGCGKLKCGGGSRFSDGWNMRNKTSIEHELCFSMLDTKYMFYLSFENSLCRDYITEKGMDMVFRHKIVPVVLGGANYSLYLPPISYINTYAPDMSTSTNVANLMKFLATNEKYYRQFFSWKKHYYTVGMLEGWNQRFCTMCARLNNQENYKRLYSNIYDWIYKDGHGDICYKPRFNI